MALRDTKEMRIFRMTYVFPNIFFWKIYATGKNDVMNNHVLLTFALFWFLSFRRFSSHWNQLFCKCSLISFCLFIFPRIKPSLRQGYCIGDILPYSKHYIMQHMISVCFMIGGEFHNLVKWCKGRTSLCI